MSFRCIITTLGQAKFAAAIAGGTQVNVTHIAVGDGNGNPIVPSVGQLALVREVHRTNVSSITVNPANASQVIFEGVVDASVGGWTARELGLFDDTGAMVAVANIGDVYKPTVAEGSAREMVLRVISQVDQTDAVNLIVDPSFYIATRSWVQSNFSVAALLPGGTTGQILRKVANADGAYEWADPLSAQNITVDVVHETQTLSAGQTVINLATATTAGIAVYIEGIRLLPSQYIITTATQFSLVQSYPAGSKLLAVQNDPAAALDYLRKSLNLAELADKAAARLNLGLGSMATKADADYLTLVAAAANYLARSGGTMTGLLTLSGAPTSALHAATKAYVDGIGTKVYSLSSVTTGMIAGGVEHVVYETPFVNIPADETWVYEILIFSVTGYMNGNTRPDFGTPQMKVYRGTTLIETVNSSQSPYGSSQTTFVSHKIAVNGTKLRFTVNAWWGFAAEHNYVVKCYKTKTAALSDVSSCL